MDIATRKDARVLVLAAGDDLAHDLCRMIQRAGLEVRAATQLDDFLATMRLWRPTHVAVGLDLDDGRIGEVQRTLATTDYEGMVVVRGTVAADLVEALGVVNGGSAATAMDVRKIGSVFDRRRPEPSPIAAERRRDPRTVRRALADLDAGLDEGCFRVVYQPKVRCRDGTLEAFEGLARWHRPDGTVELPDGFITFAEATGRIDRLTEQVFEQALAWLATELPAGDVRLCLNLSAYSLADLELPERVEHLCEAAGVAPERLVLEVTETSAAADPATAYRILRGLRDRGIWVALDDFGAGHASLLQLARHPFTDLKIDKGLVRSVTASRDSRTIIRAVVNLARSLGMRVIAEGVEDADTFEAVRDLGCDLVQGFYLAPPMTGAEVLAWMGDGGATGIPPRPRVPRF